MSKLYDAILCMIQPYVSASMKQIKRTPEELVINGKTTAASGKSGIVTVMSPVNYELGTTVIGVPIGSGKFYIVGKI